MITIKNTQRTVPLKIPALKKKIAVMLECVGYREYDIGIWFTTNATIRKYNKLYRNKDKATDILSFAFYPYLKAGEHIHAHSSEEENLGDLIISPAYIMSMLPELNVSFDERLELLLVHGICHLLGYDHETDEEYTKMKTEEERILKRVRHSCS